MEEKKKNTKPQVRIEDPMLDPYHIVVEEEQYTLKKDRYAYGYFGNLSSALHKAAKMQIINKNDKQAISLTKFIKEFEKIFQELYERLKNYE